MKRFALIAVAVVASLMLLFILGPRIPGWINRSVPTSEADPLCGYVVGSQLHCVAILGAETLLGPGAIVEYAVGTDNRAPVPLPNGALFSQACVVPGEQTRALLDSLNDQQNPVVIPEFTYHLNRQLKAGVELPVPKLADFVLRAGPEWKQAAEVKLVVPSASVKIVDENLFLNALTSFGIRSSCVDRLVEKRYRIVSKALIATGLRYDLSDQNGQSYSASLASSKGLISATNGGGTAINVSETSKTVANVPVVIGVEFIDAELIKQRPKLAEKVVFAASGQSRSAIGGSVGDRAAAAALGAPAQAQSDGGESSECESGFEVTRSHADLATQVDAPAENTLAFQVTGTIRGGHYATGNCVFGKLVNISGHDTGVTATYTATGSIRVTARSDDAARIEATYEGLPANSRLSLRDPSGRTVDPINGAAAAASGSGTFSFPIHGAGVYLLEVSIQGAQSINGAASSTIAARGHVTVDVR
jgi:hypothetical protein